MEIFFFGTAIVNLPRSGKTTSVEGIRDAVSIVISSNEQEITIKVLKLFEMSSIFPWFAAFSVFQKDYLLIFLITCRLNGRHNCVHCWKVDHAAEMLAVSPRVGHITTELLRYITGDAHNAYAYAC